MYGTLRRGEARDINLLLPTPIFVGNSQIKGMLYNLGGYPGVRLQGAQWVRGEVYQITPALERQLDAIEEVWPQQTGEYARQEVRVQLSDVSEANQVLGFRQEIACLVYEIALHLTRGKPVIASGDWLMRSS